MDLDFTTSLKFLHVLSAFVLIAGIIGRNLAMGRAMCNSRVESVEEFAQLAGRFEGLMVVPGSFIVLALGLITAWRQNWPILGFLEGGSADWLLASLVVYMSVMLLVPTLFIRRGKIFERELRTSLAEGRVTRELTEAMTDRLVHAARVYEVVAGGLIIFLMVAKPF